MKKSLEFLKTVTVHEVVTDDSIVIISKIIICPVLYWMIIRLLFHLACTSTYVSEPACIAHASTRDHTHPLRFAPANVQTREAS